MSDLERLIDSRLSASCCADGVHLERLIDSRLSACCCVDGVHLERLIGSRLSASCSVDGVHWRPCLPGGCCIYLEQSAGVGTVFTITASSAKQT